MMQVLLFAAAGPVCSCIAVALLCHHCFVLPTPNAVAVRGRPILLLLFVALCAAAAYWWSAEGAMEALTAARLHLGAVVFSLGMDLGAAVFAVTPRRCTLLLPIG